MSLDLSIDSDWTDLYIDGEWRPAAGGDTIAVQDPSTRESVAGVPAATEDDVDDAYEVAAAAQAEWAEQPPARRTELLQEVARLLDDHEAEIVDLLAAEAGGTTVMGHTSVAITADHLREAATLPNRMAGEHKQSNVPGKENVVKREPVGVVTAITPWNFPVNLAMRAVAPAIALGNAVVLKPASNTPIAGGLLLAKLFEAAGAPDGLLNVVTGNGSDIGDAVAGHDESDAVTFTGSTPVGRQVAATAAENLSVQAMELGGNNAHVVTADADLDAALDAATFGSFVHQGQVCISINRHVVHESVYDEYVERLAERAADLPTGSAHDPETVVGPIIEDSQREEMLGYVDESVDAGATIETGGGTVAVDGVDEGDSLVVEPTVLSGVENWMPVAANEHFGPVAPVIPFSDVGEAVEIANDTEYGLSGSVHAGDLDTAMDIADAMDTGHVHINDQPINDEAHVPFSGTNASGMGGYNSDTILQELTETKWVSIQREDREYPF
ncbi:MULTISPECIES: aldehyde dehydrogenase family protein [Halolamina]|uniref:Aldehyde dehydrogenase (NAD+) n=1 Tax=Halolamina pelagica TaxID=699431 RepID=A0A1I5QU91_9EURY|nr:MULTISPECIES: aldehyde dehydrogenase family protein [Halolamina]NHX35544.1 aldehyde dehydrogenase family protein [Halolamina sp. R1-12]SFP49793.1 aldehyde dehydrogenase (NAD+) [Halolamina pelagica]